MSDFYYQNQLEISENICILFVLKLSLPTFLSVSLKPFKSLAEEKQFRIKYAHMFVQMASKLKNPKETKKTTGQRRTNPKNKLRQQSLSLNPFPLPQKLTARTTEAEWLQTGWKCSWQDESQQTETLELSEMRRTSGKGQPETEVQGAAQEEEASSWAKEPS